VSGETATLSDIETYRVPPSVLISPGLGAILQGHAEQVALIYQGIVAKRTGRLAASAHAYVTVGGHKSDRLIGKVTVGAGVEYGLLHEFGSKSNPHRQAAKDLAEAVELWKGANRA
jgi:hypothetical protein